MQQLLFDPGEKWEEHWKGMPQFKMEPKGIHQVILHFRSEDEMRYVEEVLGVRITKKSKWIWIDESLSDLHHN